MASFVTLSSIPLSFAETDLLIASFNMLNYGDTKANFDADRAAMVSILLGSNYTEQGEPNKDYDIIFLQEIVSNGRGIKILCDDLEVYNYTCKSTKEIRGDGTSPELYTVAYKNDIDLDVEVYDTRTTSPIIKQGEDYPNDQMVRPPMKAVIIVDNTELIIFNNHIKPAAVAAELSVLQDRIEEKLDLESRNIIVLGDLNAGGATLSGGFERHDYLFNEYDGWYNVFTDDDHTTFADETKSYDRMILSESMYPSYTGKKGIIGHFSDGTSFEDWEGERRISDHKLIWAEFTIIPDGISEEFDHTYTAIGVIIAIVAGERLWRRNP